MNINRILAAYGLGEMRSCKALSGGFANENYRVATKQGTFLLRVCKQQTKESIAYELWVMEGLRKLNFPAAFPLPRRDGMYLSCFAEGNVMLYEFVEGEEPKPGEPAAREIGHAAGLLSRFSDDGKKRKENYLSMTFCERLASDFSRAKNPMPDVFSFFETELEKLKPALRADLPSGVVHGDMFADNTVFSGNKLRAVIDFEEACHERYLFEIGVGINGFCFLENRLQPPYMRAYVSAYERHRKLTEEERGWLFDYICWGALAMIAWHLRNRLIDVPCERQERRVRELMDRIAGLREHFSANGIFA